MNIDDYLRECSNHFVFVRWHKKTRNVAIAYYFMNVLDNPPQQEWTGKYGTISNLIKACKIPKNKT